MQNLEQTLRTKISQLDIPVVDAHQPVSDPHAFLSFVRNLENFEGFIVAWDDGYRVKIKADQYVNIHRAKDAITQEKNVVEMIFNDSLDDVLGKLPEQDRQALEEFRNRVVAGVDATANEWHARFKELRAQCGGDRKRFALEVAPHVNQFFRNVCFKVWDGGDMLPIVKDIILSHTGTATKVNLVRDLWKGEKWIYGFSDES